MPIIPNYISPYPSDKNTRTPVTHEFDACGSDNYSFTVEVDGIKFGFLGGKVFPDKIEFSFDPYLHGKDVIKHVSKNTTGSFEVRVRDTKNNVTVFDRMCTYQGEIGTSYGSCCSTVITTICFKRKQYTNP